VHLARLICPELIRLEMRTVMPPAPEGDADRQHQVWSIKEAVLDELAELVSATGRVGSVNRLRADLVSREKKATTGLANGVAVPHVRTREARELLIGFARSTPGIEFGCLDGGLAHVFFVLVAPPFDDTLYLRIYKQLAEAFIHPGATAALLAAASEGEVIRVLKEM
jgi:mannitol/fructose-specific phosphotransferase system IIA component (Ntr-type)